MMGGGQERRRRAGTENVAAIAGFGAAAQAALSDVADATHGGAPRCHRAQPGAADAGAALSSVRLRRDCQHGVRGVAGHDRPRRW